MGDATLPSPYRRSRQGRTGGEAGRGSLRSARCAIPDPVRLQFRKLAPPSRRSVAPNASVRADARKRSRQVERAGRPSQGDRKSTRLNSSHVKISYAVFCLKKKKTQRKHF